MSHKCRAADCKIEVPLEMFMCRKHWFSLPKRFRDRIWKAYREGQSSSEYCKATSEAVLFIAVKEGKDPDTILYDMLNPAR